MNPEQHARNLRAHLGHDRLDFAHKLINRIVFRKAQKYRYAGISQRLQPPRVADIGCGTGYLLKKFISAGWNSVGLDPFPRGESLERPLRGRVIRGTVEAIGSNRFDLLTAVEVIEHSGDYLLLLSEMRRALVPGGRIIVTVPNDWEFQTVTIEQGAKEPKYGHLWKFDAPGLQRDLSALFEDVGVEEIYSRWLDRRSFSIIRRFPASLLIKVSDWLVRRRKNGAWLLAWGTRAAGRHEKAALLSKQSAVHYLDSRS